MKAVRPSMVRLRATPPFATAAIPICMQEYQDAHGKRVRWVDHHMLLPREIIGSLHETNKLGLVSGEATCLS